MAKQSPQAGEWMLVPKAMLTRQQRHWLVKQLAPFAVPNQPTEGGHAPLLAAAPAAPPSAVEVEADVDDAHLFQQATARIAALEKALTDVRAILSEGSYIERVLSIKEGE